MNGIQYFEDHSISLRLGDFYPGEKTTYRLYIKFTVTSNEK